MIDEGLAELERRSNGAVGPVPFLTPSIGLWPGLYVVAGPLGVGKTQLLCEAAVRAASAGIETAVHTPAATAAETTARLLGAHHRRPWPAIYTGDRARPDPASLVALPLAIRAAPTDERLVVTDRWRGTVDRTREQTVLAAVDTKLTVDPRQAMDVRAEELLEIVVLDDALGAAADGIFVLLSGPAAAPDSWRSVRLGVAHLRYGTPFWIDLRFNGTWFEEDADEIELAFTDRPTRE